MIKKVSGKKAVLLFTSAGCGDGARLYHGRAGGGLVASHCSAGMVIAPIDAYREKKTLLSSGKQSVEQTICPTGLSHKKPTIAKIVRRKK